MEKKQRLKRTLLYLIPIVVQIISHIVATMISSHSDEITIWNVIGLVVVTVFCLLMGEGYASFLFVFAGIYDRAGIYIAVIPLSVVSALANFVGYFLAGIEGYPCLWMTIEFICIDIFLFVFSIVRTVQLSSKKNKKVS